MKSNRTVSFVVVPPDGKKTFTLSVPVWVLHVMGVVVSGFVLMLVLSIFLSNRLGYDLSPIGKSAGWITSDNAQSLLEEVDLMKQDIDSLMETNSKLQFMLHAPTSRPVNPPMPQPDPFERRYENLKSRYRQSVQSQPLSMVQPPVELIALLKQQVNSLKHSFQSGAVAFQNLQDKYLSTPSIWPLIGSISSGFGFRLHPILGEERFHTGVDIAAWTGAPIKATADGFVEFAGWAGTYGYMVRIRHLHGYSTLYGHASQLFVSKNQRVKKGQMIAQVGSTGLSTGPHLHYEVRRWNIPLRPEPFLNLATFAANSTM